MNLYQYVHNDPLDFVDPLGKQAATATGTIVAPGPGTLLGLAIDVLIALGITALALAALHLSKNWWERLMERICIAKATNAWNNCRDRALKAHCPATNKPEDQLTPEQEETLRQDLENCDRAYANAVENCLYK